jgi:hypothetical protein
MSYNFRKHYHQIVVKNNSKSTNKTKMNNARFITYSDIFTREKEVSDKIK